MSEVTPHPALPPRGGGRGTLVGVAVLLLGLSAVAGAEGRAARDGFYIGFAGGGGGLFGTVDDATLMRGVRGLGGAASLRLGTTATEDLLWVLQLDVTNYLVDVDGSYRVNQVSTLTLGGQYYVREAFWLKAGVGVAGFIRRDQGAGAGTEDRPDLGGLSGMGGGGLDVFRTGRFVLDLELGVTMSLYKEGAIVTTASMLGFNWY
jgi:hypothetical protein